MKKQFLFIAVLLTCSLFCNIAMVKGQTQSKTIANLVTAFKGESGASAKYAAFAAQADKEGYPQIAMLFRAASKAESIHADNHKKVLEKMGQKVDPVTPTVEVKSTRENLQTAINGEGYEISTMYPGFIETAKSEKALDASKSFSWAFDTEKKHHTMYQEALKAYDAKTVASMSMTYFVCPKCGNTFNSGNLDKSCPFCMTESSKYIRIK
jgi:rubrerythrin